MKTNILSRDSYTIENIGSALLMGSTIRQLAIKYNVSKSTMHNYIHKYVLPNIDDWSRREIIRILKSHFDNKHIRGGQATSKKWQRNRVVTQQNNSKEVW